MKRKMKTETREFLSSVIKSERLAGFFFSYKILKGNIDREANVYRILFMSHIVQYAVISFVSHKKPQ